MYIINTEKISVLVFCVILLFESLHSLHVVKPHAQRNAMTMVNYH